MRLAVLIPSHNEARTIGGLVRESKKFADEVVVVDDGSTDDTSDIARREGANVITHPGNKGKGASVAEGLDYLNGRGFDAVILMDGDGQHDPSEIPKLVRRYEETSAKVVVGNRMNKADNMPIIRRLTNRFMSIIISVLAGQRIPDSQCGFRLISQTVLNEIRPSCPRFEMESELLLRAARHRLRIESVDIKTIYGGQMSHIIPVVDTIRFVQLILRHILDYFCGFRYSQGKNG
jgi:glycosyltransferase involved in cell wall biosynthesis